MASNQFADVQSRPTEFLDFTSLTLDELQQLVLPFEAAFQTHMAAWRLDGKPRTARQFRVYKNCPLPTPEDRLFFILTYLKTYALQVLQGRLFGMGQSKAHQWIHVLLPVLLTALRTLGRCPCPFPDSPGAAPRRHSSRRGHGGHAAGGGTSVHGHRPSPPFAHDGTERRIVRPQGAPPAAAPDRACQQQCQALSDREGPHASVEGGCPRSGDGTLLRPAQLPGTFDPVAANNLIEINSMIWGARRSMSLVGSSMK